jgi:uncharacterized phiE125 gp8 family phage protein
MMSMMPIAVTADAVDALKTYLRVDQDADDPALAAFLAAAIGHAEAFTRMILIQRSGTQRLGVMSDWQRLSATPVRSITQVMGIPAEGTSFSLPSTAYAIDIDNDGDGWIRVMQPGGAGRVDIGFTAGLAVDWFGLPEALALGVLRLASHLYAYRDDGADAGPPAAVAALLSPYRRMRLS